MNYHQHVAAKLNDAQYAAFCACIQNILENQTVSVPEIVAAVRHEATEYAIRSGSMLLTDIDVQGMPRK